MLYQLSYYRMIQSSERTSQYVLLMSSLRCKVKNFVGNRPNFHYFFLCLSIIFITFAVDLCTPET